MDPPYGTQQTSLRRAVWTTNCHFRCLDDPAHSADDDLGRFAVMKTATAPASSYSPVVTTLSNGITVVVDRVPSVASCAMGIWVRTGTRDEARGKAGVAHFVEHMAFRRTKTMTARKIAARFEDVGAYANAWTTKEETCFYVRTLVDNLESSFRTLAELVIDPVYTDSDVEKERHIITEEIRAYEDEAEEFIFDLGETVLFGNHPLAPPIVGTVESVSHIQTADVQRFHDQHYVSGNIIVCVAGNVNVDDVLTLVESTLGGMPRRRRQSRRQPPTILPPHDVTIRKSVQQAHILWQRPTFGLHHTDKYALQVLNTILGDGMSSRLNTRVRESKGFAYSIYSQTQLFADCGVFSIYAGVDERRYDRTNGIITEELTKLVDKGVTDRELQRARQQLRASRIMSLESLSSRMSMAGKGLVDEGAPEDPFLSIQRLEAVTADDVRRLAHELCDPSTWGHCMLLPSGDER